MGSVPRPGGAYWSSGVYTARQQQKRGSSQSSKPTSSGASTDRPSSRWGRYPPDPKTYEGRRGQTKKPYAGYTSGHTSGPSSRNRGGQNERPNSARPARRASVN